jgi:hypothetical protein
MTRFSGYVCAAVIAALNTFAAGPPVTVPACTQAPVIDGVLDDACWRSAAPLIGFVQIRPGDNAPPSRQTSVLLARDAETLYIAVRAVDDPSQVRATLARRDNVLADDTITLYLDTFDDHRRAYVLTFNPLGIQQDGVYTEGREIDYSLDVVLQSKGVLTADGYAIEIALPFSSIRHRGARWGLLVERRILHLDEDLSWTPRTRGNANLLAQSGTIDGFDDHPAGRMVEAIPGMSVAESGSRIRERYDTRPVKADPNVTMKLALASDLVIDATVNPDFAQIESDQLVSTANVRFPIFYEEKRPFFLEGSDIFLTPLNVVHSRTIVDPDSAVKVTGRSGRTAYAALLASDAAPGTFGEEERLDPAVQRFAGRNATAGVLRLRRDIGEQSFVGGIATSYDFVGKQGRVAGFDGRLTLDANTVVSFQLLGTWAQRPFFDPDLGTEVQRTGRGLGFFAEWRRSGRHFNVTVQGEGRSPDYRADLGFTTQTDVNRWSVLTRYDSEPRPDARLLLSWSFIHTLFGQWDWEGRIKYAYVYPRVVLNFRRQTHLTLYLYSDYLRLFEEEFGARRSATHPGAFAGKGERSTVYRGFVADLQSSPDKRVSAGLTVGRDWDTFDYDFGASAHYPRVSPAALADPDAPLDPGPGRASSIAARVDLQPSDSFRLTVEHQRNRLVRNDTGRVAFDERLYSTRATYQFSAFTFIRARADYDVMRANVRGQLLLGWTPSPGTAFYAGYTDDLTRNQGFERNARTYFLKASYLVRRAW